MWLFKLQHLRENVYENTKTMADGELALRGHFDRDLPGSIIHFYLDHLFLTVSVNGEEVFSVDSVVEEAGSRGFCDNSHQL